MSEKVNGSDCTACVHHRVCSYMNDFNDICKAISDANVHKLESDGKTMSTKKVINYDILREIIVNCKHYRKDIPIPHYQGSITELTNPC